MFEEFDNSMRPSRDILGSWK